jgi:hypothetical protein
VPTPVGPPGPDETDPFDPELWDWDTPAGERAGWPSWVRATALIVVVTFGLLVIASYFR